MSVPPQVLERMMGARGQMPPPGGGGGAPSSPATALGPTGGEHQMKPAAAPMPKPQEKQGLRAAAMTNVQLAINMLQEAWPAFGAESEEGKAIERVHTILKKITGGKSSEDLVPAEVLHMVRQLPQAGGGTAVQQQIMKQMQAGGQPGQAGSVAPPMPQQRPPGA